MGKHELQLKELLEREQPLQRLLTLEQGLHDKLHPLPMLMDPSGHSLAQILFARVKPGRQLPHWLIFKQLTQLATLHCKIQAVALEFNL
jgi:hypothetical protein